MSKVNPNVFRLAASAMRELGKCNGRYYDGVGVCMVGALSYAMGLAKEPGDSFCKSERTPEHTYLSCFIAHKDGLSIPIYSDSHSLDECCEMFEACAAWLEKAA